ncbi:two-component sensor histidine kinase [Catellatospora sp. IY07-71]|uniref:sensor histidine kinase n=1 Tax=Catellatospora sp. IY07-71 TaxID=2728827 RepID=UPI001BB36F41|nr:sensor histidine kinase [Catellatospora sp. IY07-71]BCJ76635.1 two-component sensor histidine kinase [Catellatospora sp. IY07-71]
MTLGSGDDGWARPGPTVEQRRADVFVAVAVTALALFNLTLANSAGIDFGPPPSLPEQVCWTVAVTAPLALRRRLPLTIALVVAVAFIGAQVRAQPEQQLAAGALFCVLYTAGAWGRDHRRSRQVRLGIITAMISWLLFSVLTSLDDIPADAFEGARGPMPPLLAAIVSAVLLNTLALGFAYFFGETAWVAARRQHQLEVQAEQLRRSRDEAGERAVMGERLRIARELHDVVAHHVSVMGVQAAASRRVMDKDPARARTALEAIEQSARAAVDELRRMLALLRHGGRTDEAPATVGVDRVESLLAGAREAGLTVRYGVFGVPVPLPDSLSQAVYRIVQESVTNTLKHAGAATLDVRLRYLAHELEVESTDDGRGGPVRGDGGLGLIGMRERVAAHDGTLEAGPRPQGGFRVRARFPLAGAASGAPSVAAAGVAEAAA